MPQIILDYLISLFFHAALLAVVLKMVVQCVCNVSVGRLTLTSAVHSSRPAEEFVCV